MVFKHGGPPRRQISTAIRELKVGARLFSGGAFEGRSIGGAYLAQTELSKVEFRHTSDPNFNPLKVHGVAHFENTIFRGAPDFLADFDDNFQADEAEFKNTAGLVWLDIKSAGRGFFRKTKFSGPVSFADSTYADLYIMSECEGRPSQSLDKLAPEGERAPRMRKTHRNMLADRAD